MKVKVFKHNKDKLVQVFLISDELKNFKIVENVEKIKLKYGKITLFISGREDAKKNMTTLLEREINIK
ncbi:MAG: hypothetical protein N2749_01660 [Clostridia bacterium]|nr:hypothetical protein [Clostridia bacterium]